MKFKSVITTFICFFALPVPMAAQVPQEVTLTVSSDGTTKEDATKNALRSAIEQAYGAFVSANTTILNDELVKDEIVTVSNGSIKDYKEISAVKTDNGNHFVTLTATVSLPNLISYAKSHGNECEFAGNTFGMEMKLFELQKENELKALYNLAEQMSLVAANVMEHVLTIDEPRQPIDQDVDFSLMREEHYYPMTPQGKEFYALPWEVDAKPYKESDRWRRHGKVNLEARNHIRQIMDREATRSKYYVVPMKISWKPKSSTEFPLLEIFKNTIQSLSLNKNERESYEAKGITLGNFRIGRDETYYYFRNANDKLFDWCLDLFSRLQTASNNFVIKDNTNTESEFYPQVIDYKVYRVNTMESPNYYDRGPNLTSDTNHTTLRLSGLYVCDGISSISNSYGRTYGIFGTGIFYNLFKVDNDGSRMGYIWPTRDINKIYKTDYISIPKIYGVTTDNHNLVEHEWIIRTFIPKEDIGKYSRFWIEPKE